MLGIPDKYRYPLVLAMIAAAMLAVGLALKPQPNAPARKSNDITATRAELENLQRLIQRNSLRNMGTQFSAVAEDVSLYLFPLANSRRNAIAWSGNDALVPKPMGDLPHTISISANGQAFPATPEQWTPGVPFAFVRSPNARANSAPSVSVPPEGAWVVAVGANHGHPPLFRPGIYNGTSSVACGPFIAQKVVTTIALAPELVGGGIFDLQGNLVAVIAECDDGLSAIAPDQVRRALHDSAGMPLLSDYGMGVTPADAGWKQVLGQNTAVVVTDVWRDWPADVAGLQPGDSFLSVDGQPVSDMSALVHSLTTPADRHLVEVRRGGRRLRLTLPPLAANSAPLNAVQVAAPDQGVVLERVAAGSSADRAGLRAADRVLQINGAPADPASVLKQVGPLQVSQPLLVVARRGPRTMGMLLR